MHLLFINLLLIVLRQTKFIRDMLLLKLLYFFASGSLASVYLYQSFIYFQHFQLSKDQVGLLASITPFVSLFATPTLMFIAEKSGVINMKQMMLTIVAIGAIIWSSQLFVPVNTANTIPLLSVIATISGLTVGSIGSFLDAIALQLLGKKSKDYGKYRLFGSLAWGISSLLIGLLIQYFDNIWCAVYVFFVSLSILFCLGLAIDYKQPRDNTRVQPTDEYYDTPQSLIRQPNTIHSNEYDRLLRSNSNLPSQITIEDDYSLEQPKLNYTLFAAIFNTKSMLFFIIIFLLGLVFSVIGSYLFIYLTTTWKVSTSLLGLTTPFSVFCELPLFFYSDLFLRKLGPTRMLAIAHCLMLLRLLLYMLLPSLVSIHYGAYLILFVEVLHGASFGLYWSAGIESIQTFADPAFKSTFVGIFSSLSNNGGGILGNILGGIIYENFGYYYLWATCLGLVCTSSCVLFALTKSN